MNYTQLKEYVDAEPFTPFRLRLTDGRHFDITAPSMCLPGRATAMIGLPDVPSEPDVPGMFVSLAMLHIITLEPIQVTA